MHGEAEVSLWVRDAQEIAAVRVSHISSIQDTADTLSQPVGQLIFGCPSLLQNNLKMSSQAYD